VGVGVDMARRSGEAWFDRLHYLKDSEQMRSR
jgi:hypothetical protein